MKGINIKTFEELEEMLRNWASFGDSYIYDHVGMATLFSACLDNIQKFFLEEELKDFKDYLSEDQIGFLLKLVKFMENDEKID